MSESRKKSVFVQIFIGVAVAFLVGGTSPWWWEKIFSRQESPPTVIKPKPGTNGQKPIMEPNITSVSPTGKFVVTGFNTPLFRSPDLSVPIDYLPRNKRFEVMQENKKGVHVWFKITYDNKNGWVPAMSVTLEE